MLPNRTHNTNIELRKTKYKKVNNFVKAMADDGIVQLDTSDPGAIQLTAIDRNHHLVRQAKSNVCYLLLFFSF